MKKIITIPVRLCVERLRQYHIFAGYTNWLLPILNEDHASAAFARHRFTPSPQVGLDY